MTKDKVGVFSWFGYIMPLEERLKIIKDSGFNGVAIWWEDEEGDRPLKKEEIPSLVQEAGLLIENIHAPFCDVNNLWSENESLRKEIVYKHIEWIKDCNRFNIPVMVMHVSEWFKVKEPNNIGLISMSEIIEAAEEYAVKVAIENTDNNALISFILDGLNSPNLGLCFDTSHNEIAVNNEINLLEEYGHRLFATHISDNDGLKDRHWLPFDGHIDWEKTLKAFPKNYSGYLSMEISSGEQYTNLSPEEYMKKAFERIDRIKELKNNLC